MTDPFVNRELWWLEENGSLLDDAPDPAAPPLARLRALAAISANLDEFFMGRIPPLKRLARDRGPVARRVRELVDAQRLALLRAELGLSDDDVHAGAGVVALSGLAALHAAVAGPRRARPSPDPRPAPATRERVVAAKPDAQVPALARYR